MPYPKELEANEEIPGVGVFRVRPIRPQDAPKLQEAFDRMTPEDRRLRFFAPMNALTQAALARATQIDYDREMALLLETADAARSIVALARMVVEPDGRRAEFAVTVRSDFKRRGLGVRLLRRLVAYARERGIKELFGDILAENTGMLALAHRLGFATSPLPETAAIVRATLDLTNPG